MFIARSEMFGGRSSAGRNATSQSPFKFIPARRTAPEGSFTNAINISLLPE